MLHGRINHNKDYITMTAPKVQSKLEAILIEELGEIGVQIAAAEYAMRQLSNRRHDVYLEFNNVYGNDAKEHDWLKRYRAIKQDHKHAQINFARLVIRREEIILGLRHAQRLVSPEMPASRAKPDTCGSCYYFNKPQCPQYIDGDPVLSDAIACGYYDESAPKPVITVAVPSEITHKCGSCSLFGKPTCVLNPIVKSEQVITRDTEACVAYTAWHPEV